MVGVLRKRSPSRCSKPDVRAGFEHQAQRLGRGAAARGDLGGGQCARCQCGRTRRDRKRRRRRPTTRYASASCMIRPGFGAAVDEDSMCEKCILKSAPPMLTVVERVLAASLGAQRWDGSPITAPRRVCDRRRSMSAAMRSRSSPADARRAAAAPPRASASSAGPARRRGAGAAADRSAQQGRTGDAFVADALACFEQGDAREQQSWLRAIALWPEARAFLPSAIDACRTNIIPVFEALACENPVPGGAFSRSQLQPAGAEGDVQLDRARRASSACRSAATRSCRAWRATTPRNAPRPGARVPADIDLALHDAAQGRTR